ncbi:gfo/Idh/MocA family oxidoreductase, partial [Rhizobium ruizarguesonis]
RGYGLEFTNAKGTTAIGVSPKRLSWASRPWHNIHESVYAIQQHWVDQMERGAEHATSGADNLKTFVLVEAAYDSAA